MIFAIAVFILVPSTVSVAVLVLARRRYRRLAVPTDRCACCGYAMNNLPTTTCPECGFDAATRTVPRAALIALLAACLGAVLTLYLIASTVALTVLTVVLPVPVRWTLDFEARPLDGGYAYLTATASARLLTDQPTLAPGVQPDRVHLTLRTLDGRDETLTLRGDAVTAEALLAWLQSAAGGDASELARTARALKSALAGNVPSGTGSRPPLFASCLVGMETRSSYRKWCAGVLLAGLVLLLWRECRVYRRYARLSGPGTT